MKNITIDASYVNVQDNHTSFEYSINGYFSVELNVHVWGIERSGFFNDRGKWAKGFENQRV